MVEQTNISRKIKSAIVLTLLVLLMIFTLQNSESVAVAFFLWEMSMPRALIFFVFFLVGFFTGLVINNWKQLTAHE